MHLLALNSCISVPAKDVLPFLQAQLMQADFKVSGLLGGSLKPCSKPPVAVPMPDILPEEITDLLTSLESTLQTTFSRSDVLRVTDITSNTVH